MALRSKTGLDKAAESDAISARDTIRARLATYSKNTCPQCSQWLLAPDWSEYQSERCVRHTWSCDGCGYEFETAVYFRASDNETQAAAA